MFGADAAPPLARPFVHERLNERRQLWRPPTRRGHVQMQVAIAQVSVPHHLRRGSDHILV